MSNAAILSTHKPSEELLQAPGAAAFGQLIVLIGPEIGINLAI
jgi:hypothetical protein